MVGGGPSGLSAALAARRAGAEVILMERWALSFRCLKKKYLVTIHHKDLAALVAVSPPWAWRPWLGTGA